MAKKILKVSESLHMWGQGTAQGELCDSKMNRRASTGTVVPNDNYFKWIAADKEIVKSVLLLTGSMEGTKAQVMEYIETFTRFDFLYMDDLQAAYTAFMNTNPSLEAFENELKKYMDIEKQIQSIAPVHNIGAMSLETQPLKYSLKAEAAAWKSQFAKNMHSQGKEQLEALHEYMHATTLKLNRKAEDLEDVRVTMSVLKEIREKESELDTLMTPIEEIYSLLGRYEVRVPKEETETVSELRYGWGKMKSLAESVAENLSRLQVGFKRELIKEVKLFVVDAAEFGKDWDANGPSVPGLEPMEAVERLKNFQTTFAVRKRKWDNYRSGEELFGLHVTPYPELEKIEKEIDMLDKLYSLYSEVNATMDDYADVLWSDVKDGIDGMEEKMKIFQQQSKYLPKSLKDWPAYNDCKKKIDEFLDGTLPLVHLLCSKDMRPRHWTQLQELFETTFDLGEAVFKFGTLIDLKMFRQQEEVEDLAGGADAD